MEYGGGLYQFFDLSKNVDALGIPLVSQLVKEVLGRLGKLGITPRLVSDHEDELEFDEPCVLDGACPNGGLFPSILSH